MGLDMYLNGKRYLSQYLHEGDREIAENIQSMFPELQGHSGRGGIDDPFRLVREVMIEAGYWRKANHIHKWFVDNVQNGVDDCGYYNVERRQLEELRQTCSKVLEWRYLATDCLPTMDGFFFGGTDYDDYYFKEVEHTVKVIDFCLGLPNCWDFQYHSSW